MWYLRIYVIRLAYASWQEAFARGITHVANVYFYMWLEAESIPSVRCNRTGSASIYTSSEDEICNAANVSGEEVVRGEWV